MSYNVRMKKESFGIPADKIEAALNAVLNSAGSYDSPAKAVKGIKHFEFLPPLQKLVELTSEVYGFDLVPDAEKRIVKIRNEWEGMRNCEVLFEALAPYVNEGSFIECQGEDGAMWRYVFRDGKVKEIQPKIVWEE